MITHMGPHRRLWMGPQFTFCKLPINTTLPANSSAVLASLSPESQNASGDLFPFEGETQKLSYDKNFVFLQTAFINPL